MKKIAPYTILHEEKDFIVVDKASGLSVTADRWDDSKDRLDELLRGNSEIPEQVTREIYLVHRIDRDTSGLVVLAKDRGVHRFLSSAFESRRVQKTYLAVVRGRPAWTEETCELPLRPDGDKAHRTIIDRGRGKPSVTTFTLLGSAGDLSWVRAEPHTGRTHQIRAHLAAMGFPIACDTLYGRPGNEKPIYLSSLKRSWRGDPFEERPLLERLALHALSLSIPNPSEDGTDLSFEAPLHRDMAALLKQCEKIADYTFD